MKQQSCCCPVVRARGLDLQYAARLGCNFPLFLEPKGCCACLQSAGWAGDDLQSKASVIWAQFCFLSLMVWQLVTVGAPQYDANPPDLLWSSGEKKYPSRSSSPLFTPFSRFSKRRINQLYTHVHYSLLFPSICLFSSQWSFRLDMHCENVSCSASFFFSFFHSLSLSTVCH